MVLPEEFVLPPPGHLLAVLLGTALVGAGLWRRRPPVTQWTAIALLPWMALGGALHAAWVRGIAPEWALPLLSAPAVYLTTAVLAGAVWYAASLRIGDANTIDGALGVAGVAGVLAVSAGFVWAARAGPGTRLFWPAVGLVGTVVLTAVGWAAVRQFDPSTARITGWAGAAVFFGHALDGVTTAIGMDVLGTGERSPIPRLLMDAAGTLPTADLLGVGWAFVLVKLLLAGLVVWLFQDYVAEAPARGYLLLALFAAVGVGPGTHNLLLFLQAG